MSSEYHLWNKTSIVQNLMIHVWQMTTPLSKGKTQKQQNKGGGGGGGFTLSLEPQTMTYIYFIPIY